MGYLALAPVSPRKSLNLPMPHSHDHGHANFNKAFALGVALNVVYIIVEVAFGLAFNSLALLADAGHNTSDVLGLILAWGAHYLVQLPASERRTYGWKGTSILAALFNALILLIRAPSPRRAGRRAPGWRRRNRCT
jgi:Co/Zn/Cd efflux system component